MAKRLSPQDFAENSEFGVLGEQMVCRLHGKVYTVEPQGEDHVQIFDGYTHMATLTMKEGRFVAVDPEEAT